MKRVFPVLICSAMVAILAFCAQMLIPVVNVEPGQSFTVKINISAPEEFSLAKMINMGGQYDISNVFLQYIKHEGLINVTKHDGRISFLGNASLGQAWFRFDNVNVNDSGTYGVLYKKANSADIFTSRFEVNVTRAYLKVNNSSTPALACLALSVSFDGLLLVLIAVVGIVIQL